MPPVSNVEEFYWQLSMVERFGGAFELLIRSAWHVWKISISLFVIERGYQDRMWCSLKP